jgi:hypothetical protein
MPQDVLTRRRPEGDGRKEARKKSLFHPCLDLKYMIGMVVTHALASPEPCATVQYMNEM